MRWLPARVYDNGVYYAITNPISYDGEHLKNGNAMILDPYGAILSEVRSFDNGFTISKITKEKIKLSGGWRYNNARRPDVYREIRGRNHDTETTPVRLKEQNGADS